MIINILLISAMSLFSSAHAAEAALKGGSWSPYIVGFLIGVLTWLTFGFSSKPVGASSSYASLAGMIGKLISKEHTMALEYFRINPPNVNWEFVFVGFAIMGSFFAAITGNEFEIRWVPELWAKTFGENSGFSYGVMAFYGGILMAFGARLAGGCTSGHGISGTLQLSVASWVTVVCFFLSGVLFVRLIY